MLLTMSPSHRICGINKLSLRAHRTRRLIAIQTHERASNKGKDEASRIVFISCATLGYSYYLHQKCKGVFLTVPQTGDTSQWLPLLSIILGSKEVCHLKETFGELCRSESNSGPTFLCGYLQHRAKRFGVGSEGMERVLKGRLSICPG